MRRWRNTECSKCSGLAPSWQDSFEPELKQIIDKDNRKTPIDYPESAGPLESVGGGEDALEAGTEAGRELWAVWATFRAPVMSDQGSR